MVDLVVFNGGGSVKSGFEGEEGVLGVSIGCVKRAVLRCSSPRCVSPDRSGLAVCEAFDQGRLAAAPRLS